MKNIFLSTTRNRFGVFGHAKVLFLFLFMSASLVPSLSASPVGQPSPVDNTNIPYSQGIRNDVVASGDACPTGNVVMTSGDACPTREEVIAKTRMLRMPFIANNGQVDEQVRFYAKTFGGTVFVTKEGEIVYSLPDDGERGRGGRGAGDSIGKPGSRGAEGQGGIGGEMGWRGQPLFVGVVSEVAAQGYGAYLFANNFHCPPDHILTKALIAAYLPGLRGCDDTIVGTRRPCSPRLARLPGLPKSTDKHHLSTPPQSPTQGVALKEHLVGGKIGEIRGGSPSVTKVSYFKGNDPSKWRSNLSTYQVVDMGEVYNGIGLQLKAHGNNVEKLFTVRPGANPGQIRIRLDGIKSPPVLVETHGNASLHGHQSLLEEGKQSPESPSDVGWVKRSAPNKNGLNGLNQLNDFDGFASLNPSYTSTSRFQALA